MTVGERLKAIRKEKGLTQKQVASGCGMADSAIRKYGLITPKLETIQRIANALGVHVLDLLGVGNELDTYQSKIKFSSSSSEARPLVDFVNSSDIRTIYNSLSGEEQEELLAKSGLIPMSEPPEASGPPQSKSLSESEIMEQIKSVYGETIGDTFSMYVLLDAGDQGEIRGEIKQMLKQGKYLKQEGNWA